MSHDYNNNQFSLGSFAPIYPKEVLASLLTRGLQINGTRELINTRIVIERMITFAPEQSIRKLWHDAGANTLDTEHLFDSILTSNDTFKTDLYDSKYYTFLRAEILRATEQFKEDSRYTRRAVLTFPTSHCFESIQVMFRDEDLIITVNMRSCNAYKNLMSDLYLAFKLGLEVAQNLPVSYAAMTANIGSLHIFEEDLDHVFRDA